VVDLAGPEMGPFVGGGTGGLPPLFRTHGHIAATAIDTVTAIVISQDAKSSIV
jgi:galactokinase/mevalonate kinase-like predicted kinase